MTKKIWMYWHQGFEQANEIIQQCVASWRHHNPDWELVLLDADKVGQYISPPAIPAARLELLKIQHLSDLIRTQLLIQYGGVWADPTCFCVRPLSEWLEDQLPSGFFCFHQPGRDRIMGNWFMAAAKPKHLILTRIYEVLCSYWSSHDFRNFYRPYPRLYAFFVKYLNRSPKLTRLWFTPLFTKLIRLYPYFIYHYIVYELICTDARCAALWAAMPKVSAQGPPKLYHMKLLGPLHPAAKDLIDSQQPPLFKLKWKLDTNAIQEGTVLHYLFSTLS